MKELSLYKDPASMTPLLPEKGDNQLNGLALDLIKKSAALSNALNPTTREALVRLIEPMNSYWIFSPKCTTHSYAKCTTHSHSNPATDKLIY